MATNTTKKVFLGALFEFGPVAAGEVIEEFRRNLPPSVSAPFVSYANNENLFSFVCNRDDTVVVPNFIGNLKAYVDNPRNKASVDLEDPKIKPLPDTTIKLEDLTEMDDAIIATTENPPLVDADIVSEGSDIDLDDSARHQPGVLFSYWTPSNASIEILTVDVANRIVDSTEAGLWPEADRNRIQVVGGNNNLALSKLNQMENLLAALASQLLKGSMAVSGNVLMLPTYEDVSIINFKPVWNDAMAAQRIIVNDEATINSLSRKCISEVHIRESFHNPYGLPTSLTQTAVEFASSPIKESSLWADYSYPKIGNPMNIQPNESAVAATIQLPPKKYVTPAQGRDIEYWTENIDDDVDPEKIGVAQLPAEITSGTQRVLAHDSDSSDEEDEEKEYAQPKVVETVGTLRGGMIESGSGTSISMSTKAKLEDEEDEELQAALLQSLGTAQTPNFQQVVDTPREEALATGQHAFSTDDGSDEEDTYGASEPYQAQLVVPATSSASPNSTGWDVDSIIDNSMTRQVISTPPPTEQPASQSSSTSNTQSNDSERMPPPAAPTTRPFDPRAYGLQNQGSSTPRGCSPNTPSTRGRNTNQTPRTPPRISQRFNSRGSPHDGLRGVSHGIPQGGSRGSPQASPRGSIRPFTGSTPRGQGSSHSRGRGSFGSNSLIDIAETTSSTNVEPPPGYNLRMTSAIVEERGGINFFEDPPESMQIPPIRPLTTPFDQTVGASPLSSAGVLPTISPSKNSGKYYINTKNPKPDINVLKRTRVAELKAKLAEQERLAEEAAKAQAATDADTARQKALKTAGSRERKQRKDEPSNRTIHNAMNQQAGKLTSAKNAKQPPKETPKEQRERVQRARDDAFGTAAPNKASRKAASVVQPDVAGMSAAKKKALKKNPAADPKASAAIIQDASRQIQTERLITQLVPIFEAGRAFCGDLGFEIQLGQVLLPTTEIVQPGKYLETKNWEGVFNPPNQKHPAPTSFTSVLTTSGGDIDRIVDVEHPLHHSAKAFDPDSPGPSNITYEFHCQSKDSEDFFIVVDQKGTHRIQKGTSTVGGVNMHYPGQIWDARAVLQGVASFFIPSEELKTIADTFMKSVHVAGGKALVITYQLPNENDMIVRKVTVKRTSLHSCRIMDRQNLQLKITEVRSLYHKFHQQDNRRCKSFEKSYETMVKEDRIQYQVSILDKIINALFERNRILELGDLTDADYTSNALLSRQRVRDMIEIVSHVVSNIDWAGYNNQGTLLSQLKEQEEQYARMGTMPAGSRFLQSVAPASTIGGRGVGVGHRVPGVRMDTEAAINYHSDGTPYRLGLGGAQVPLPLETLQAISEGGEDSGIAETEIVPGDSASQVGGGSRRQIVVQGSTVDERGFPLKPVGFW